MVFEESNIQVLIDRKDFQEIHYDELALHKEHIPLDPDYDRYLSLESKENLKTYLLKDGNKLVGYAVFLISPMLHYKSTICAANDILYISKEHRKGMTGVKFIKYCEQKLKEEGVNKITWHIKLSLDFSKLLARMGYIQEDIIVGKVI
jgi:predicted acetyltransferase